EACLTCQQQLQRLATDRKSWDALDRYLNGGEAGYSETLRQTMKKLRDMTLFPVSTQDEVEEIKHMALDFLDPPTKPDHLGKFDHYEILQELGRGGRGIVLKALDPILHRIVALKVIAPQFAAFALDRERFLREARAAAAVWHKHVVTIYTVVE